MKKLISVISILCLLAIMSFTAFDFYSSMTKVEYVEGSKTLKFTTKLNTNHISQAIKIDPNTAAFDAEVKSYINSNVSLSVNGSAKTLTFTGSQVNGESVFVYYEAGGVSDISSLGIKNSILIGAFPKQVNTMSVSYKGNLQTVNFSKVKETAEMNF